MSTKRPPDSVGDTPPTGASVTRIMASGLASSLERFDDAGLLNEGRVNLIALDAVVARLGRRWPLRRDQVYDHVQRTLQRHLGLQGYFARISETDFLVCQPELSRFCGQAACLRYLREILTYFIGEATQADNCVHRVTKITAQEIQAQAVDAHRAEREEAVELAALQEKLKQSPKGGTVDQWTPFVASDGRELRVTCSLEPVYELKTVSRIGLRMVRRVLLVGTDDELTSTMVANLSRADILRIDLATMARGADRLRADVGDQQQPSLIIPVSFSSLSSQRGRAQIVTMLKAASSLVKRGVICEINDIEGVPQGAMLSVVSLIRPFSLFAVGRLDTTPPSPASVAQLKGAGLRALSLEVPRMAGDAEFLGWAKASIGAARQVVRSVLVYRVDSERRAGLVAQIGASHASIRGQIAI